MNLERRVSGGCFLDVWVMKHHAVEFAHLITAHTVCMRLTNLICGLLVLKPQTICSLLFTVPSLKTIGTKLCCCFSYYLAYLWQKKKKNGVNLTKDPQIQCKSRSTRAEFLVFHWVHHRWCKDKRRNSWQTLNYPFGTTFPCTFFFCDDWSEECAGSLAQF